MKLREGLLLAQDRSFLMTQLEKIMARTSVAVDRRKGEASIPELERRAAAHTPRGFAANLRKVATTGPAIISELKKASPSKGMLRADYRPVEVARRYEAAGAAAISVLTDEEFFLGSLTDLEQVSAAVTIPVLRKDFMLDNFQVLEARAAGADAILLIVAAHEDAKLQGLKRTAEAMELDVLCEVHNEEELKRGIGLGCTTIGVNCRNLKTLEVDLTLHEQLAGSMPESALRVAESGIATAEDLRRLAQAGYDAFLVGETLMRHADPGVALTELRGK